MKEFSISPAALGALVKGDMNNFIVASIPGGIERQEAEGQQDLVTAKTTRLPKEVNNRSLNSVETKDIYASVGIEIIGEYDDLFFEVKLPSGWKLEPTEHSMWSNLIDEKGRERAGVFYKAAFYDRNAHLTFNPRFRAVYEPEDAYKSNINYEERNLLPIFGRVYDGGELIFETPGVTPDRDWEKRSGQEQLLHLDTLIWLSNKGYEEITNPLKYWE